MCTCLIQYFCAFRETKLMVDNIQAKTETEIGISTATVVVATATARATGAIAIIRIGAKLIVRSETIEVQSTWSCLLCQGGHYWGLPCGRFPRLSKCLSLSLQEREYGHQAGLKRRLETGVRSTWCRLFLFILFYGCFLLIFAGFFVIVFINFLLDFLYGCFY